MPFDKAIEKWVGDRKLSELTDLMVGDMGEAMVAHKLARQGFAILRRSRTIQGTATIWRGSIPRLDVGKF
ncbi:MAG: hypothetical protein ABL934_04100 [Lysobacteraceae bacterium]